MAPARNKVKHLLLVNVPQKQFIKKDIETGPLTQLIAKRMSK